MAPRIATNTEVDRDELLDFVRPRHRMVLIASGEDDPLSGGGQLVELLAQRYREAGLTDATVKVYPGARHEILTRPTATR